MASVATVSKSVVCKHAGRVQQRAQTKASSQCVVAKQFGSSQLSMASRSQPALRRSTQISAKKQMVDEDFVDSPDKTYTDGLLAGWKLPKGFKRYETMFLFLPDATEEEMDAEFDKLEDALVKAGAHDMDVMNRGRQPLAYNINYYDEALYIQLNYIGPGTAPKSLEKVLSRPVLGDRKLVMRFMTHVVKGYHKDSWEEWDEDWGEDGLSLDSVASLPSLSSYAN